MVISSVEKLIDGATPGQVQSGASVREACKVMCELGERALIVFDGQELVGILSGQDVIRRCICADRNTDDTDVTAIMTRTPVTVAADSSVTDALEVMQSGGFHHIPVMKDGQVIGLLELDNIPEEYHMLLERFKEMQGK